MTQVMPVFGRGPMMGNTHLGCLVRCLIPCPSETWVVSTTFVPGATLEMFGILSPNEE